MPEAVATPVRVALGRATSTLVEAGCDTPQLDAELLLGEVLECDRAELVLRADAPLSGEVLERFDQLIARRAAREPVAYILGRKDFRRIRLSVDPRVLIPRPETELLVEVGLSVARGARVLDVGTGSGAVALALKDERPDLFLVGVDVSPEALAVARDNAARLCLNVAFVEADLLPDEGPYDAVLANLPYVADGDPLPPEIELFEPGVALFAGADGLDVIRRLIPMLSEVPLVAVEVGVGQASAVADLFARAGFRSIEVVRDLARIDRVVVGRS